MTEADWLACEDPTPMLAFLQGKVTDRKLRLFAVACWRRAPHLLKSKHQQRAIEVAERYADGLASLPELAAVRGAALGVAAGRGSTAASEAVSAVPLHTRAIAAASAADPAERNVRIAGILFDPSVWTAAQHAAADAAGKEQSRAQAGLLRDIFGSLAFRPVNIHRDVLAWNDGTVRRIAEGLYEDRKLPEGTLDTGRLAILADALLDAGCDDEEVLAHCREQEAVHTRGCWVLDLLLGKA
jgi:hypothetical protein